VKRGFDGIKKHRDLPDPALSPELEEDQWGEASMLFLLGYRGGQFAFAP
jgi:hypothetical protein